MIWQNISLSEPKWLWLIALAPIVIYLIRRTCLKLEIKSFRFETPNNMKRGQKIISSARLNNLVFYFLMTCLIVFTALTLTHPQSTIVKNTTKAVDQRIISLMFDESYSMDGYLEWDSEVMPPSKLKLMHVFAIELLQQFAMDTMNTKVENKIGYYFFGDDPFKVWKHTNDILHLIRNSPKGSESPLPSKYRGTWINKMLILAVKDLMRFDLKIPKILLLVTDGLDSITPEDEERITTLWNHHDQRMFILIGIGIEKDASVYTLCERINGVCMMGNTLDEFKNMAKRTKEIIAESPSIKTTIELSNADRRHHDYTANLLPIIGVLFFTWLLYGIAFRKC